MNSTTNDQSKIVDFYRNKSIFITGASGFIGKVLVEKLLRACPKINKIYMLLRSKKGQLTQDRLEKEFIGFELFEKIDKELMREKLVTFDGDITADDFGLFDKVIQELCTNVNIVFHVAASVRFDDPMKQCIRFNVIATKTMISLCHEMNKLDCFVHVSSAYAHCQLKTVEEHLYPIKATASQIIEALDWMDEKTLGKCSEFLMDGRPNTYTFTKAVAEHCVNEFRGQLPVAIARPSIVTSSLAEPLPGWVDSWNGPAGASLLGTLGIAISMVCSPNSKADLYRNKSIFITGASCFIGKVLVEKIAFDGDITADDFGLFHKDILELCTNVNIVFHVIKSTASQTIEALDWMDEKNQEKCFEFLMNSRPKTYTFTKAVAEHCVNELRVKLPVSVVKKSNVNSALISMFFIFNFITTIKADSVTGYSFADYGLCFLLLLGAFAIIAILVLVIKIDQKFKCCFCFNHNSRASSTTPPASSQTKSPTNTPLDTSPTNTPEASTSFINDTNKFNYLKKLNKKDLIMTMRVAVDELGKKIN